jgi:hypothetical protein
LELLKKERENDPDEIETEHPGYLLRRLSQRRRKDLSADSDGDTYSSVAFAKLYTAKVPVTAADTLNDRVLPFFDDQGVDILRILTDRGTEFCGAPDKHPYEIFLQYHEIEHTKTRARRPQSNGICESFHKTVLNEFYRVTFRKKIYQDLEELQKDLDEWIKYYNNSRTHQGKRCQGRTPTQTFMDSLELVKQKNLDSKDDEVSVACQL